MRDRIFLATIGENADALAREYGLGLEIDTFCVAMNMDTDFAYWDKMTRNLLQGIDRAVFHAPYSELTLCAIDPMVREIAMNRYIRAAELSMSYGIRCMVIHSGYIPRVYFPEWFTEQGSVFLQELLGRIPTDMELLVENVLEDSPEPLFELMHRVNDPRVGVCLDVGHAHVSATKDVEMWIDTLNPYIRHYHLHDNDGTRDHHDIPGNGTVGFPRLFERIGSCSATFECMDAHGCVQRLREWGMI